MSEELERIIALQSKLQQMRWNRGNPAAPIGSALIALHRHSSRTTQFYSVVTAPAEDVLFVSQPEEALYFPQIVKEAKDLDHDIIEIESSHHRTDDACKEYVLDLAHAYCATYMDALPSRFTVEETLQQ